MARTTIKPPQTPHFCSLETINHLDKDRANLEIWA